MDDPKYEPVEYDEFDDYRDNTVTNVGLPAGQLALIIGVNAVISLVISISVVLLAGRQVAPGDVATPLTRTPAAVATGQPGATTSPPSGTNAAGGTPVQSVTYTVAPGDTLSGIAGKFAVPLSDLMVANGLTNQDFIQVGQKLTIPVGGMATPSPTFTPMVAPTDTPLPFEPPTVVPTNAPLPVEPAATVGPTPTPGPTPSPIPTSTPAPFGEINIFINEVTGAGDLPAEILVILNKGAGVSLADWKLKGSTLGIFVFPDIFLFSGGSIRIHTAAGENTASDLYLNQGEAAWSPGMTIILSNNKDVEISRFVVPSSAVTPTATP